jgi:ribosomal protein S6--L-glutamate ligase
MTGEEMRKLFKEVDELQLKEVEVNLTTTGANILYQGQPIKDYDCVYLKGSYKYMALLKSIASVLAGKCYTPLTDMAFTIGHNKLLTHLKLQQESIPMPTTYISSTSKSAKNVLEKMDYPIVMKFPEGTQGKGVMFAESYSSASSMLDALSVLNQPFILQEFIDCDGQDIRAIVVGDKVVASMKRSSGENEQRSNIHAGGTGEPVELDAFAKRVAVQTAKALGAEICGVDILQSVKGPLVIELNLSPGLQGITEYTKVNVAEKIAKYLHQQTIKFVESKKNSGTDEIFKKMGIAGHENNGVRQVITHLDFRLERILLPDFVSKLARIKEEHEVCIKIKEGKILIERLTK